MNIRSIGLFCLFTLSSSTLSTANFAKKALHWSIAAGPLWMGLYQPAKYQVGKLWRKNDPLQEHARKHPPSPEVADFIHTTLVENNYSNPEQICLIREPGQSQPYGAVSLFNLLSISEKAHDDLEKALKEPESFNRSQKLYSHKSTIQHEAGHLKNKDSEKTLLSRTLIPFVTHAVVPQWYAVPKFFINSALIKYWMRLSEWKADENINDDKNLLQAARDRHAFKPPRQVPCTQETVKLYKKCLQDAHKSIQSDNSLSLRDKLYNYYDVAQVLFTCLTDIFSDHPFPAKRAARFQQRLDALQAKQEKQTDIEVLE